VLCSQIGFIGVEIASTGSIVLIDAFAATPRTERGQLHHYSTSTINHVDFIKVIIASDLHGYDIAVVADELNFQ
jgi:hypothetical protein